MGEVQPLQVIAPCVHTMTSRSSSQMTRLCGCAVLCCEELERGFTQGLCMLPKQSCPHRHALYTEAGTTDGLRCFWKATADRRLEAGGNKVVYQLVKLAP